MSILASSEIILDMVCKLQKPNVALCHQMPFTTDQKGFAQTMEKVCSFSSTLLTLKQGPQGRLAYDYDCLFKYFLLFHLFIQTNSAVLMHT